MYEPERLRDGTVVWHLTRLPPAIIENVMTIGIWAGHAFLIRDIEKLGKLKESCHTTKTFSTPKQGQKHSGRLATRSKRFGRAKQELGMWICRNPHAILYDFESCGDNNQRKEPTNRTQSRTRTSQSLFPSETRSKENPPISVKEIRLSLCASLWKNWKGVRKTFVNKF